MGSQEGKVAVVTGASRGIGKATALALADAGFDLVLAARTVRSGDDPGDTPRNADGSALPGSLEETRDAVSAKGRRARVQRLDLLEPATIEALVADTLSEWGRIDVLVNNAIYQGPGLMADFLEGSIEELEKVFEAKGSETPVGHLANVISAYIQLEELDQAVAISERVLETHAMEDRLWVLYADAL